MIIKIFGSTRDSEQIEMLFDVPSIKTEDDAKKFEDACHQVYNDPEFEDADYEDVINEALSICDFKGEQIYANYEVFLEN